MGVERVVRDALGDTPEGTSPLSGASPPSPHPQPSAKLTCLALGWASPVCPCGCQWAGQAQCAHVIVAHAHVACPAQGRTSQPSSWLVNLNAHAQ